MFSSLATKTCVTSSGSKPGKSQSSNCRSPASNRWSLIWTKSAPLLGTRCPVITFRSNSKPGLHYRNYLKEMARKTNPPTWKALKQSGHLQERHVLMAMDLGMSPSSILREHAGAEDRADRLLLEWLEDRFFAKHGHYSPDSEATP